jgi:DNA-binding CsgD family transcriptional regulator
MQDQIAIIQQARRRDKRLLRLRARGQSLQEIADAEGISRQRVSVLLRRAARRKSAA